MNKTATKVLALCAAAMMTLTACTGNTPATEEEKPSDAASTETKGEAADKKDEDKTADASDVSGKHEITDLVLPKLAQNELTTFNILHSETNEDFEILFNLVEGLLEKDSLDKRHPCVATEWGTEDGGLNWTFKLRNDVKWVDMNGNVKADCVADDFLTALVWTLKYQKHDSIGTSMPCQMIKGAQEYYDYTKGLSKEEAYALNAGEGSKFREMVAVEAPDAYTLHYTCTAEKPYFDSLMSYTTGMPMSQAMIDELGGVDGVRAMNNENMWYNSCYTMTSYLQGNEKVLTKNPEYWDKDCFLFDTVTIRMVESNDVAYQLYQSGEVDYVKLGESMVKTISENPNHEFHDYLVPDVPAAYSNQFHWNYDKHLEDGSEDENWNKAIANENFRKAMYYGLDLTDFLRRENTLDPLSCQNDTFTCDRLSYTSDGRDYTDLVKEKINLPAEPKVEGKPTRYDPEKGQEYKAKAMEELTAQGVTFPVELDWFVKGGNQQALDMASVLQTVFKNSLGDDFITVKINQYVSSINQEVRTPKLQSVQTSGWGADYSDPENYLTQMVNDSDAAWYATSFENIKDLPEKDYNKELIAQFTEFTRLVNEAVVITKDMDARYDALATAEAYLLEHALVMPSSTTSSFALSRFNTQGEWAKEKIKNFETCKDGYTYEEMVAIREARKAK